MFECFKGRLDGIYGFYPTVSRIYMKRYLPTLLLLIILSTFISFSVVFFLHNGLGKSLCLIGYILLAASILSFLFFLSIDPGYGWVKSANLHKNHRFVFLFIILFIVSISIIILGLQLSASHPRAVIDMHAGAERQEHKFPAR